MAKRETKVETGTIEGFIDDAYSAIEELKGELEEWKGNLPENLQNGQKGDELDEAMNNLSNSDYKPDVPESVANRPVSASVMLPKKSWGRTYMSKADRRDNALALMDACIQDLQNVEGDDEAHSLMDTLQEHRDEFEQCEFPRAFG